MNYGNFIITMKADKVKDRYAVSLFIVVIFCIFLCGCYPLDYLWYQGQDTFPWNKRPWRNYKEKYVAEHPDLGCKIKIGILKDWLVIGMKKEEVELNKTFANPDSIKSITEYGADTKCIYKKNTTGLYTTATLYFKTGILIRVDPDDFVASDKELEFYKSWCNNSFNR